MIEQLIDHPLAGAAVVEWNRKVTDSITVLAVSVFVFLGQDSSLTLLPSGGQKVQWHWCI